MFFLLRVWKLRGMRRGDFVKCGDIWDGVDGGGGEVVNGFKVLAASSWPGELPWAEVAPGFAKLEHLYAQNFSKVNKNSQNISEILPKFHGWRFEISSEKILMKIFKSKIRYAST